MHSECWPSAGSKNGFLNYISNFVCHRPFMNFVCKGKILKQTNDHHQKSHFTLTPARKAVYTRMFFIVLCLRTWCAVVRLKSLIS